MLFESVRPVAAGYFECQRFPRYAQRDRTRQASLLYMTSGQGAWKVGPWTFPIQRGDMIAIPVAEACCAEVQHDQPLGYYYAIFEMLDQPDTSRLAWPWDLGVEGPDGEGVSGPPYASGPFRPEIVALFRQLQDELGKRRPGSTEAARAHLLLLGVAFGREWAFRNRSRGRNPSASGVSGRFRRPVPEPVAQVVDHVQCNLERDLSLGELARVARFSETRLVQIFRETFGLSPMAYVRERRIREAQRLLLKGTLTVKEIAGRLNFADAHHFSRVFRQVTGISPSAFADGQPPLKQRESGLYAQAAGAN